MSPYKQGSSTDRLKIARRWEATVFFRSSEDAFREGPSTTSQVCRNLFFGLLVHHRFFFSVKPDQRFVEVSPDSWTLASEISTAIDRQGGAALIVDYGRVRQTLPSPFVLVLSRRAFLDWKGYSFVGCTLRSNAPRDPWSSLCTSIVSSWRDRHISVCTFMMKLRILRVLTQTRLISLL